MRQCLSFAVSAQLAMSLLVVIDIASALPPVMPLHFLLWLLWVAIPCIALPTPAPPDVMHMTVKRTPLKRSAGHGGEALLGHPSCTDCERRGPQRHLQDIFPPPILQAMVTLTKGSDNSGGVSADAAALLPGTELRECRNSCTRCPSRRTRAAIDVRLLRAVSLKRV